MDTGTDLSKSHVRRIVKAKLTDIYGAEEEQRRQIALGKDILTGFTESGRLFIHHVTTAANEVCRDARRTTISGEDILNALKNLGFEELIQPLTSFLEEFRVDVKEKNRKKAEIKQKREEEAAAKEKNMPEQSAVDAEAVACSEEVTEKQDIESNSN